MQIGKLKAVLENAKPDAFVVFSFGCCRPTTGNSWRGIYAEPAIGWEPDGETKVSDLILELNRLTSGEVFYGWKGGEYTYTDSDTLHVDNPGRYTCTEITHVTVKDWEVVLHTEKRD